MATIRSTRLLALGAIAVCCVSGAQAIGADPPTPAKRVNTKAGTKPRPHDASARPPYGTDHARILLLHHSTGGIVVDNGVPRLFDEYNRANGSRHTFTARVYPKGNPYPWENYPYDFWNIWVQHAGPQPYREEDTLEILTRSYDVIVWKHCFPVSAVGPDTGSPDVTSRGKSSENYRLQYEALKTKMHSFPRTMFIVWTGAALTLSATDPETATRAKAFFDWVKNTWDEKGDNIYVWDFRSLETRGGLYLAPDYANAAKPNDSHPNEQFGALAASKFVRRVLHVVEGRGDTTSLTGD